MNRELGVYIDQNTGERYMVLKRTQEVNFTNLGGRKSTRSGAVDYITSCGLDLNPVANDLESFELVQSGGIIRKEQSL